MKASVSLSELAPVLAASNSLGTRYSVPVLAGIRLSVSGNRFQVARFDYEVAIVLDIFGGVSDGEALVNSKSLADAVKALAPKGTGARSALVHFAIDGEHVTVSVGNGPSVRLDTLPIADYPTLPSAGTRSLATLSLADVKRIVSGVVPMAGKDQTIPMLTGVQLVIGSEFGTSVAQATNRYIAARLQLAPFGDITASSMLLPAATWKLVAKLATSDVTLSDNNATDYGGIVTFTTGAVTVMARTLDPDFPKLAALFPDAGPRGTVHVKPLASAVKTAATMAGKLTPVRLTVTADDTIDVAISGGEDGAENFRTSVQAEVSELRSARLETAFDPGYLLTILGALNTSDATWRMPHNLKPAVFSDGSLSALIMPMRLPEPCKK